MEAIQNSEFMYHLDSWGDQWALCNCIMCLYFQKMTTKTEITRYELSLYPAILKRKFHGFGHLNLVTEV